VARAQEYILAENPAVAVFPHGQHWTWTLVSPRRRLTPQLHHPVKMRAAFIVQHVISPSADGALVAASLTISDNVERALAESQTRKEKCIEPQVRVADRVGPPQVYRDLHRRSTQMMKDQFSLLQLVLGAIYGLERSA
jgi:hypothetical protein